MTTLKIISLILGVLTFIGMVIFKHKHDLKKRRKGIWITHWKETLKILFPFSAASGTFFLLAATCHWWIIPTIVLMITGSHWFFFDGITGLSERKGWWWTGGVDGKKKDSLPDRILRWFPLWGQKIIKFSALLIPIVVYVLTLLNGK